MTIQRDSDIEARYLAGETPAQIGQALGLSRERVRQILQARGLESSRDRARRKARVAAEEVKASGSRLSVVQAARAAGVHPETVRHELTGLGYDPLAVRRAQAEQVRLDRLGGKGTTTCNRCEKVKSWGDMSLTSKGGVSRRRKVCKTCVADRTRAWYAENKGRTQEPTVAERACTNCGQIKPADEFHRNASTGTGLASWCRACSNAWRRRD